MQVVRGLQHNACVQVCMQVTESLLLLAPEGMVEQQGAALGRVLVAVLGDVSTATSNVRDDGTVMALEVAETLLAVQPAGGAALLEAAGVARKVVAMALGGQEASLVTAQLLCVLARMCASDTAGFLGLLGRAGAGAGTGAGTGGGGGDVVGAFVDACVARVDHLMLPRKRRVVAVAMANLVGTGLAAVLERLGDVMNLIVEVLHQERRDTLLPAQAATAAQVKSM